MNILKKLNRGAILSTVIFLVICTNLIITSAVQKSQIPEIKAVCEQYMQVEVKYSALPQKYRAVKPTMPKEELEAYISEMKDAIAPFYPADSSQYKNTTEKLAMSLRTQSNGTRVVIRYVKELSEYTQFNFIDDTVTVVFKTKLDYAAVGSPTSNPNAMSTTTDTLKLIKTDTGWKIISSQLNAGTTVYFSK